MKQLESDVVVVGGGTAGLAATVAAAQDGANVIIFEKSSTTGGTGNMGNGPFAVESKLQRLRQISITRAQAFKIHMDFTHWRVDARLVSAYINKSASTIDWLESLGVEFAGVAAHSQGFNFTWHVMKRSADAPREGGSGATMTKILTDKAKELGVKIFLRTATKKILKEGGRITGVIAEDSSGEEIRVSCRAVIIATGGFGDNPDWIKKYAGYEYGHDLFSFRIPGLAGDGLRMAWEVGSATTPMSMEMICGIPQAAEYGAMAEVFRQPNLMVNLSGERFIDEGIMVNSTFTGNAVSLQKDRCAFLIFDEDTKRYYEEEGLEFVRDLQHTTKIDNLDSDLKKAQDKGYEHLFISDSLEELASKTGIDLNGLRETVAEYNKACETGRDELFHKDYRYLKPVKRPKFYAGRIFPGAFGSLGGIKINNKTEVMTKEHDVIPGLYAAGVDANSIYADSYIFILPGNTMGFAINTGRMAGENAAKFVSGR